MEGDAACEYADIVDIVARIDNFSGFKTDTRVYTPVHTCGGFKWRLLIFPQGNRVTDVLSVYLDFVGPDDNELPSSSPAESSTLPPAQAQASSAPLHVSAWTAPPDPRARPDPGNNQKRAKATPPSPSVVEARVWFSVVPPPSSPPSSAISDDSSGVISTHDRHESDSVSSSAGNFADASTTSLADACALKECSHRFTEPDNDWGFRELMASSRAKRYLHDGTALVIKAHVVVYWKVYTSTRDQVMSACTWQGCNWLDIVNLVQVHGPLAANAPTRVGLSNHNDGASLLHAACKAGNKAYAGLLLARGASADVEDDSSRTPLFYAARAGHLDVVAWLIDEVGLAVNARDSEQRSALFYACELGLTDMVGLLISKGADISLADDDGDTPARIAEGQGHDDLAAMLRASMT
jgi:Ankyrin repeats (3 copies)/Ankyrin repeats (many copies)/MATH domain